MRKFYPSHLWIVTAGLIVISFLMNVDELFGENSRIWVGYMLGICFGAISIAGLVHSNSDKTDP